VAPGATSGAGSSAGAALRHPGRDPELSDLEILVGLHQDPWWRKQYVLFATSILGEVVLQLDQQRFLVAVELLAVGR
jgi:hypothetical protein